MLVTASNAGHFSWNRSVSGLSEGLTARCDWTTSGEHKRLYENRYFGMIRFEIDITNSTN